MTSAALPCTIDPFDAWLSVRGLVVPFGLHKNKTLLRLELASNIALYKFTSASKSP